MTDCATLQPDASYADRYLLRAEYYQGGCFGRCPIYTLSIYDNGLMVFQGERFTEKEGTWQKLMPRAKFAELMADLEDAGFAEFPQVFPSNVADLSTKRMLYHRKTTGENFSTSWKESSTPKLENIASQMRTLAESADFKFVSEDLRAKRANPLGINKQVAKEELIIQLVRDVEPRAWVVKFNQLGLQYKSRVTPNNTYYLFEADPNRMPINEQLDMIRQDDEVLGAQTNKRVSPRN
ncbi:hypothetical protein CEQ90_15580 [Lewinellaceae bacterium SD302]|nr:hypothetical protein CEQ90_15580 [Lewinellaceae bacterium SD302]